MEAKKYREGLESVLRTLLSQSQAMKIMAEQYRESTFAREQMAISLLILHQCVKEQGKIVMCGVGKSHKVANKLVATMNSLSIQAVLLHPSEALHGDLGIVRDGDVLIFITASGNTPELLQLLPHVPLSVPVVLITCNKTSKLSCHPQVKSLMYAELPAHLSEDFIHGIPAPTVSTTLSLALADAAILALSELIEADVHKRRKEFSMKHPGGSIGAGLSHLNDNLRSVEADQLANGKSFSSQVSSSSLLSLTQIQKSVTNNGLISNSGSLDSDDEPTLEKYVLQNSKQPPNPSGIDSTLTKTITTSQINSTDMSELYFLKYLTLYDYLVLEKEDGLKSVVRCNMLKALYKAEYENYKGSRTWESFLLLLKDYFL